MLKKAVLSILFVLPLFAVEAAEFKKGTHFVELSQPINAPKGVTEFFSFYCPACFKQEPLMNEIKASLPEGFTFRKNHVDNMPGRDLEAERMLTKALITANRLGVADKVVPAIFNYIHVSRAQFTDVKDVKNLFLLADVKGEDFDKAFKSFSTNTQLRKMSKDTQTIRSQGHSSVPTLIINGRYKPVTSSIKSIEEYKQLVLFLLNK